MNHSARLPEIPGVLLTDTVALGFLTARVAELCGLNSVKFPGSQPVSFNTGSLELLENKNFWVCEKSDGIRVLIFVVMNGGTGQQEVWLIDRKQQYYKIEDLHFTHWEDMNAPLTDTILDGELVIDVDPKTGEETLRYYAFDCLVLGGENVMSKNIEKRFARLREWVVSPHKKALAQFPEWRDAQPFELVAKVQELSYHIQTVLKVHIPELQHGHDGLIFTCAEAPYFPGTDEQILKWKSPSENSIDFKLELRFPALPQDPSSPDFSAKPMFCLHTWLGQDAYEYFDDMEVEDEEWERMKETGEQYDDRIIEVAWDTDRNTWRMMRVRDDKPHANHKSIMVKIIESITDGVEIEAIITRSDAIRSAWKARDALRQGRGAGRGAPPPQVQPPMPTPRSSIGPGAAAGQAHAPQPAGVMAGLKR